MKKTVDIDEAVLSELERLQRSQGRSLDEVVNQALRVTLGVMPRPARKSSKPFVTRPVDVGECRFQNLDNVEAILSLVEGEYRK